MSDHFYSRGAEDRKPVSLTELHKVRYGIVTLRHRGAARQKHGDGAFRCSETKRQPSLLHAAPLGA